jgi:hypothetical protein
MNNQTPKQFLNTLHALVNSTMRSAPEFIFMVALKNQLLDNNFERETAHRVASQFDVPLPPGAAPEQLQEMGYYCADLITKCHDDLQSAGGFDGPSDEAALLAQRIIREALA